MIYCHPECIRYLLHCSALDKDRGSFSQLCPLKEGFSKAQGATVSEVPAESVFS